MKRLKKEAVGRWAGRVQANINCTVSIMSASRYKGKITRYVNIVDFSGF